MKLGVSNLAWAPERDAEVFALLAAAGARGVEVAPTKIAGWDELTPARLCDFRRVCNEAGLEIPSLQAILFNQPQAQLLGDGDGFTALCEHMRLVGGIAARLGAKVAVFGAPRNRSRGDRTPEDAEALAAERFTALGNIAAETGLIIGIEPVPTYYGCDFLDRAGDLVRFVTACGHPNVRAHLDAACITLGGDDLGMAIHNAAGTIAHYHISEPDLAPLAEPKCDHAAAAQALDDISYAGWLVIEMRQTGDDGGVATVAEAVNYAKTRYAPVLAGSSRPSTVAIRL